MNVCFTCLLPESHHRSGRVLQLSVCRQHISRRHQQQRGCDCRDAGWRCQGHSGRCFSQ
jgi:hypothetical protein